MADTIGGGIIKNKEGKEKRSKRKLTGVSSALFNKRYTTQVTKTKDLEAKRVLCNTTYI
jgi:hypothetical protein